jgi:hypothetical protein
LGGKVRTTCGNLAVRFPLPPTTNTGLTQDCGKSNFEGTAKMRKEVKTVEQWKETLRPDSENKAGDWKILAREMFNSKAFAALTKAGIIVVLAMVNHFSYEKKSSKDRKGVKCGGQFLRNKGIFYLTGNELKARGLKSDRSIADGKKQAWQLGFFDVIETGSFHSAGKFQYSERWKEYPHGDYQPKDERLPGRNLYHSFGDSIAQTLSDNIAGNEESTGKDKVITTGNTTRPLPAERTGKKSASPGSLPAQNTGNYNLPFGTEVGGPEHQGFILNRNVEGSDMPIGKGSIQKRLLTMQLPAKVMDMMKVRGHDCISGTSQFKVARLRFTGDVSVEIHPRYIIYSCNGNSVTVKDCDSLRDYLNAVGCDLRGKATSGLSETLPPITAPVTNNQGALD